MANLGKWSAPALTTVMSTELNSLANGSAATSAGTYDNTGNLNVYADFEVNLAALSPGNFAAVTLFILESVDGTNFPAQSTADIQLTSTQILMVVPTGIAGSAAQRIVTRQVVIPPAKMQFMLLNSTGVSLASSGNTVKLLAYSVNLNG